MTILDQPRMARLLARTVPALGSEGIAPDARHGGNSKARSVTLREVAAAGA
jgi:hypothetical protein